MDMIKNLMEWSIDSSSSSSSGKPEVSSDLIDLELCSPLQQYRVSDSMAFEVSVDRLQRLDHLYLLQQLEECSAHPMNHQESIAV